MWFYGNLAVRLTDVSISDIFEEDVNLFSSVLIAKKLGARATFD